MLKVEHQKDYLKGANLEVTDPVKEEQNAEQSTKSFHPKLRVRRQYNPNDNNLKLLSLISLYKNYPALINDIKGLLNDVDISYRDKDGDTFLHAAVQEGHQDVVKLLLEKGAKIDIKNNEGKIPLELAKDQEIINMLKAGSSPGRNSNIQPEHSLIEDRENHDLEEQDSQVQAQLNQDSFDVYSRLKEVTFDSDDSDNPGVWAGMDQINSYINNQAIKTSANGGELAYYIGPNNFGFDSTEGIKDIAKHICRRDGISNSFYGDKSSLDKPFIVISNTATVLAQSSTDVNQQGGTHWISWVLLPKKYVSLSGKEINNGKYQVLFFDSLSHKSFPEGLKKFLTEGGEITEKTDKGEKQIRLMPFCKEDEIDFKSLKDLTGQQKNGNDCGWWATYYALMSVYTGGVEFLEELKGKKLSAKPLRRVMSLHESTEHLLAQHQYHEHSVSEGRSRLNAGQTVSVQQQSQNRTKGDPVHGNIYQLKLLMLFLHRGLSHNYSFRLGTEIEEAKKFDDLVFEYAKDGRKEYRLLQAKHRLDESKKITADNLLTESDGDYSLIKYFFSYQDSKKEKLFKSGSIKDITICTNIDLDYEHLKSAQIRVEKIQGGDDILDVKSDKKQPMRYRFSEDVTLLLKPKLQDYNLTRLARRLAECFLQNNSIKEHDNNDIFKSYHIVLAEEVIDTRIKKFHDKFIEGRNISEDTKKFREVFIEEIKKQSKEELTLENINEAITNKRQIIGNKQVGLNLSKKFGKGKDKNWPNDAISDDEVKDFLKHLVFAVNQPNEEELGEIVKEEVGKEFSSDSITTENIYNKFFMKMLNLLQGKEMDRFFSYEEGKEFFEEARRGIPIWFDVKKPVELFTGRKEELSALHNKIQRRATVMSQMTAISGLGGIGKTELARKYIDEHSKDYDGNIIWINAESETTLVESFSRLAKDKLGINTKDANTEEKDIKSIVGEVYRFFSSRRSLFVFDNAEKNEYFKKFLPRGYLKPDDNKPYILITSRNRELGGEVMDLNELKLEDVIEFVKKGLSIPKEDKSQDQEIEGLVKKLQRFPLAIQQAIAYIEDQKVTGEFGVNDYLKEYERKTKDLLNSEVFKGIDNEYERTTFTTWEITIDKIASDKEHGELALEVLNTIAYLAPEDIKREMFSELAGGDETKLNSAMRLLVKYSMVNGKEKQSVLSIHRLVQEVIRSKLQGNEGRSLEEEKTLEHALDSLKKYLKDPNSTEHYAPHIISVWKYASKYDKLIESFIVNDIIDSPAHVSYFHLIAGSSNYEIVSKILDEIKEPKKLHKVVNASSEDKKTPLHYAAQGGNEEIMELLISKKANVNTCDRVDNRPLHIAAKNGHLGSVKALLDSKVDVNAYSSAKYKFTPLHLAAQNGHLEIVNLLLERKADINSKTKREFTPLHLAADNGHLDVVEALLKDEKITIDAETEYKFTPLHLAAKKGYVEIVNTAIKLREREVKIGQKI